MSHGVKGGAEHQLIRTVQTWLLPHPSGISSSISSFAQPGKKADPELRSAKDDVDSLKNMAASDGPIGSSRRKIPQKMAVCACAGETQTLRATDPSCHLHSALLSTVSVGFPTWVSSGSSGATVPHHRASGCLWELGPGGRIHSQGDPARDAWRKWEIGIGTPGKGHGWPSSG